MRARIGEVCLESRRAHSFSIARLSTRFVLIVILILRAKRVIAARRYYKSGKIAALNASCHPHEALSHAGCGFENPILINPPAQCGVESRAIGKTDFAPGYGQRVKRAERGLGAVAIDDFR